MFSFFKNFRNLFQQKKVNDEIIDKQFTDGEINEITRDTFKQIESEALKFYVARKKAELKKQLDELNDLENLDDLLVIDPNAKFAIDKATTESVETPQEQESETIKDLKNALQAIEKETTAPTPESSPEPEPTTATVEIAAPAPESSPESEPTTPAPAQAQAQGVENAEKSTVDEQKSFTDSFRFDDSSVLESTDQAPKTSDTEPTAPAQSQELQTTEQKLTPPKKAEKTKKTTRKKAATQKSELSAPQAEQKADAVAEPTTSAQAQAPGADVVQSQTEQVLSPEYEKLFARLLRDETNKKLYEQLTTDEKLKLKKQFADYLDKGRDADLFYFGASVGFIKRERNQQAEQATQAAQAIKIQPAATLAALPPAIDGYLHSSLIEILSALFTVQPTHALKAHHKKPIFSTKNFEISTSGSDLNMFDKITFNALIRLAQTEQEKHKLIKGQKKPVPLLGETLEWTSTDILKAAGRTDKKGKPTGKSRFKALDDSITRLASVTFHIKTKDVLIVGEQLIKGIKDEKTKKWQIQFNPKLESLYKKGSYALIPIESQRRLANNFLALKMFEIFLSNKEGQTHSVYVETLRKRSGTQIKDVKIFKRKIDKVLPLIDDEFKYNGLKFERDFSLNKDGIDLFTLKFERPQMLQIVQQAQK